MSVHFRHLEAPTFPLRNVAGLGNSAEEIEDQAGQRVEFAREEGGESKAGLGFVDRGRAPRQEDAMLSSCISGACKRGTGDVGSGVLEGVFAKRARTVRSGVHGRMPPSPAGH